MPSPVIRENNADRDDHIPRVESDIVGACKDNGESDNRVEKNLSVELNIDSGSPKVPKKRGRPSKKNKKIPFTPIKSSPSVPEEISSKKSTPTVVRLSDGDNVGDDRGDSSDEVNSGLYFPTSQKLFPAHRKLFSQKRDRKVADDDDDDAGEPEVHPKKKRGRPSKKVKAANAEQENEVSEPAHKGRGRPRKSDSAHKIVEEAKKSTGFVSSPESGKSVQITEVDDHAPRRSSRVAAESSNSSVSDGQRSSIKAEFLYPKSKNITHKPASRGRGRPKKEAFFAVEKLVDKKVDKSGVAKYHVKWENYADAENTWEPIENLKGCMHLVEAYDKKEARTAKKSLKTKGG
ncbi:hypothetical protein E8E14_001949 [Neopestalotiopsis sp. 37M]|nr:hypothetical protein E8E14_001949 [Neopestalotiopsis sp. 37M]